MAILRRRKSDERVAPDEVLDSRKARAELRMVLNDLKQITAHLEQIVEDDD